eukprot:15217-Eustigmatos_ZCMA.PRE.1
MHGLQPSIRRRMRLPLDGGYQPLLGGLEVSIFGSYAEPQPQAATYDVTSSGGAILLRSGA